MCSVCVSEWERLANEMREEEKEAGLVQLGNRGPLQICNFCIFIVARLSAHPGKEHCLDEHSSLRLGTLCSSLKESINNPILPHPIPEPTEKYKGSKQMENTNGQLHYW